MKQLAELPACLLSFMKPIDIFCCVKSLKLTPLIIKHTNNGHVLFQLKNSILFLEKCFLNLSKSLLKTFNWYIEL